MKILAFDCSGKTISAAAVDDDILKAERFVDENRNHAPHLLPTIAAVLSEADWQVQDVDRIAVSQGPGSFTGLRIGIATAKGIGDTLAIPMTGVNTIDALALNLADHRGIVVPLLDARKNQAYAAVYDNRGGKMERIHPFAALSPTEDLFDFLASYDRSAQIAFLGDGAVIWREALLATYRERAFLSGGEINGVQARHIAALARAMAGKSDISPFYLRDVDAKAKFC